MKPVVTVDYEEYKRLIEQHASYASRLQTMARLMADAPDEDRTPTLTICAQFVSEFR